MNKRKVLIIMALILMTFALTWGVGPVRAQVPPGSLITGANGYLIPDYFGTPNWANSPPLTKFVDSLAPLGCTTPNNLGQCIPIALPDQDTYPGSDYYEIELVQYRERMHQGLPALGTGTKLTATSGGTKLRGYRQINPPISRSHDHCLQL
jgi:hypothetical protein